MNRIATFTPLLSLVFLLTIMSVQAQPQSSPQLVQQTKKVLTEDHGLRTVHAVQKVGNQYVLMDNKNVIFTDLLFNRQKTFDSEACHPGSPFNPSKLSRVGKSHLIIGSSPVFSYFVNTETGECSTRMGTNLRLIPRYLTFTDSGFMNMDKRGDENLEIASYSESMTLNYQFTIDDTYPFNSLRNRYGFRNSLLKINDEILIMNGADFSLLRIKDSEVTNKTYKVDVITVPIPNVNKPVDQKLDLSSPEGFVSVLIRKHYINAMYTGKGSNLLFDVMEIGGEGDALYLCNYAASEISNCVLLKQFPKGESVRYAENGEVITIKWTELSDGEYEYELTKYTIH